MDGNPGDRDASVRKKRIGIYHDQFQSVMRDLGPDNVARIVVRIDAMGAREEVFNRLVEVIESRRRLVIGIESGPAYEHAARLLTDLRFSAPAFKQPDNPRCLTYATATCPKELGPYPVQYVMVQSEDIDAWLEDSILDGCVAFDTTMSLSQDLVRPNFLPVFEPQTVGSSWLALVGREGVVLGRPSNRIIASDEVAARAVLDNLPLDDGVKVSDQCLLAQLTLTAYLTISLW